MVKKLTKTAKEKIRWEIADILADHHLLGYISIITNNKEYHFKEKIAKDDTEKFNYDHEVQPRYPSEISDYGNDDTLAIIFDGSPLYDIINYGGFSGSYLQDRIYKKLNKVIEPYGLYFEFAHTWMLVANRK